MIHKNSFLVCLDYISVLPRIEKWGDICPITSENEGTFSKPSGHQSLCAVSIKKNKKFRTRFYRLCMGTSNATNSLIWLIMNNKWTTHYLWHIKLSILNCYLKLLILIVNIVLSHYWISFLTLIPLQQLKSPSQNNSKVFLLSLSGICCIPLVTQLKSWMKHHLGKLKFASKYF